MITPTDPLDCVPELYAQGLSTRQIAARCGCGMDTIRRELRARGVALRPSRRPPRLPAGDPTLAALVAEGVRA